LQADQNSIEECDCSPFGNGSDPSDESNQVTKELVRIRLSRPSVYPAWAHGRLSVKQGDNHRAGPCLFNRKASPHAVEQREARGAKPPLRPSDVWSIRAKLQIEGEKRDLALFNLAIDSKLRGCDVAAVRVDEWQSRTSATFTVTALPSALILSRRSSAEDQT